jgi:hypothetical protein
MVEWYQNGLIKNPETHRYRLHAIDAPHNLDIWCCKQDDLPGRPEAIRRLVELGLKVSK